MRGRYTDLAKELIGCDPVLDLGFGGGEFMELLAELGVQVRGVEPDAQLVEAARGRGLDVEQGFAVDYLRRLEAGSLGGIVMIQVIEHLSPQHVIDFVELAAEKLRPGGKVVLETVNPASLYTYAHAFWVDPDHVRPVHPNFLEFLFREAEFARDRHRVPVAGSADERLVPLPGDDPQTRAAQRELRADRLAAVRRPGLRRHRDDDDRHPARAAFRARLGHARKQYGAVYRRGAFGIHQILAAASPGDAITTAALEYRDVLRQVGPSDVFARHIAPGTAGEVKPLSDCGADGSSGLLVYHASIGEPVVSAFLQLAHRADRARVPQHHAREVLRAVSTRPSPSCSCSAGSSSSSSGPGRA